MYVLVFNITPTPTDSQSDCYSRPSLISSLPIDTKMDHPNQLQSININYQAETWIIITCLYVTDSSHYLTKLCPLKYADRLSIHTSPHIHNTLMTDTPGKSTYQQLIKIKQLKID